MVTKLEDNNTNSSIIIDIDDVDKLSWRELRETLREYGLPPFSRKADMQLRLRMYLKEKLQERQQQRQQQGNKLQGHDHDGLLATVTTIKKTEEEVRIEIESNPYFKVNISRNRRIFYIKMFEYAKREGRLLDCLEFRIEQEKNQAGCDVATVDLRGVYDFFKA